MLLTIDVGNTETKLGVFAGDRDVPEPFWRLRSDLGRTADEVAVLVRQLFTGAALAPEAIDAVAAASVVPALDPIVEAACLRCFGVAPRFLRAETQTAIAIATERPADAGADLIAIAIGARARYPDPLIVASYGTATVFIAISPAGVYLGGAIAPGIGTSIDALNARAARLPKIGPEAAQTAIGRNTRDALASGIAFGFAGQTDALVARMRRELGAPAKVIATGGFAELVAAHTATIDAIHPYLAHEGLRHFAR